MIDEIYIGPIHLQLHETVLGDGLIVCAYTESEGTFSMGVKVTREEWDEASRLASTMTERSL